MAGGRMHRVEWGKRPTLRKMCYNLQQRYRKKQLPRCMCARSDTLSKNLIWNSEQLQVSQKSRFVFSFKKGVLPRTWGKTPMGERFALLYVSFYEPLARGERSAVLKACLRMNFIFAF